MMARRTFVIVCAVGALSAPLAAQAQQAASKVYRLGILSPGGAPAPSIPTIPNLLPTALREFGYLEGRNLVVDRRFADDNFDRLAGLAREMVQLRPDVVVGISSQATQAVRDATATIPIVMVISTDPVARGLVASFSRPGGNVTGVSTVAENSLAGKRLELLKEAVPKATRIAVLGAGSLASSTQLKEAQKAAEALRVRLIPVEVRDTDYDGAFSTVVAEHADAIFIVMGPTLLRDRKQIVERALKHRLAVISASPELVEAGGLMSYGNSTVDSARRAAVYVDKIFKGASPSNMPVEQPTTFELVINLKTAKALGLTIPPSLLARVDQVIE
jgi:putative tryptophan/tyrosine transport system substrate-binding protein